MVVEHSPHRVRAHLYRAFPASPCNLDPQDGWHSTFLKSARQLSLHITPDKVGYIKHVVVLFLCKCLDLNQNAYSQTGSIGLPLDTLVVSIKRDSHVLIFHGYTQIETGDRATVVGYPKSLKEALFKFGR